MLEDRIERCWAMDSKVVFRSKAAAKAALASFRALHHGHGKVVRCFPHDHWHLTKNQKGVRRGRTVKR